MWPASIAFVLIWSSGFVVARAIAPHADPSLFLAFRFVAVGAVLVLIVWARARPLPPRALWPQLIALGALMQGVYLVAGYWAVGEGMPAALMALMGALQPPLSAWLAQRWYQERQSALGWIGIVLGMLGVGMAVGPGLQADGFGAAALLAACVSVMAITFGTLMQKASSLRADLIASSALQHVGAAAVALVAAALVGDGRWDGDPVLWAALAWAVIGLSLGGTTLLLHLVRTGSVSQATNLLFLAPPLAAIQAWALFGEALTAMQIVGVAVALAGVLLARWRRPGLAGE